MEINLLNLRKSINKAYLKVKPNRAHIETFKKNISNLFYQIKESESEEFHKNVISEFLKNTYYSPTNYINTKGRSDLVIHNGKDSNSTVGVLFEVKKPGNKSEMPTCKDINTKAFHELILYYLRERITNKNIEIKYLVITNIFEWYIFNANDFEKLFSSDKNLVKQFEDFENERLSGRNTDFFYKNIAEQFIEKIESQISVTHFDIREFETTIKNADREDDNKLIALYKIFSPEHLLKLPFANDSNNLDKTFYNELLHIIGLEETKEGSKKLIGRKIEKKRNPSSLIENSITILNYEDCLSQLPKLSDYGSNKEEQLFNIALELVITWINRILFLKLLEGQLIKYNNGDKAFRFLNIERIHDYDELNKLFFQVLAVKESDRSEVIKQKFGNVPYLNSSLFEPSDLEHKTIRINSLENHTKHPVLSGTVLKDKTGKRLAGEIDPLQYLFDFLDSYDFSSEGSEDIQEENKTLINASVLGLIFEKINGYKDGSFFTPGFITMYMCHETIRRAVVQKFNDAKGWQCETISDVYNKIENIKEADRIINSLRICDPAVGSGHFLVSALNEIITIKSELKILSDREGKKLKEYTIEVINDELIITDEQSKLFDYNPKSKESQRVQEAIFQEKQKIIENCLFGVDINPNSVKICRLRLWIELLKNAYYKSGSDNRELETLPNIDINIKCGNSLISRYPLDADIKTALKSSKWTVDNYREAVMTYRNAQSKDEKRGMEQLINKIKSDFETEVSKSDKRFLKLNKLKGELLSLTGQSSLFELNRMQKDEWNKKVKKFTEEINKYEKEITEIKNNKIYENAFEWRFEFPEVLNNEGDFVGFDIIIGNPPYVRQEVFTNIKALLKQRFHVYDSVADLLTYFVELGFDLLKPNGNFQFIVSNKFSHANYGRVIRSFLTKKTNLTNYIDFSGIPVFDEATVDASILGFEKKNPNENILIYLSINKKDFFPEDFKSYLNKNKQVYFQNQLTEEPWAFVSSKILTIRTKVENQGIPLKDWDISFNYGIKTGLNEAFVIDNTKRIEFESLNSNNKSLLKPLLRGRDIQKFVPEYKDLWLIYIPKGFTNNLSKEAANRLINGEIQKPKKITEEKAWILFSENFPDIAQHLMPHKAIAEKRSDFGDYWWEQRACNYLDDFEKPKIIYPNMTKFLPFVIDYDHHYYHNDKTFHLISDKTDWLGAFFNSKLFNYCFRSNFPELLGGTRELRKVFFEKIPVKQITKEDELPFSQLINKIVAAKKNDPHADTSLSEAIIDQLVYELYDLTEKEIRIVEKSEIP
ncbi:MAG: class I SAM-dependent DNA methyltransferase [Ignavibacteria bacterium]|nr:class I SAM-dependent DNA methyltransferase [Ignavibacteria bacterium]